MSAAKPHHVFRPIAEWLTELARQNKDPRVTPPKPKPPPTAAGFDFSQGPGKPR